MLIGIDASRANRSHKSGTEWYSYHLIREMAQLDKDNRYILYTDHPLTEGMADLNEDWKAGKPEVDAKGMQTIKSPHGNFSAKVLKWQHRFFWTQGRLSLEMIGNAPDVLFVPAHTLPLIHPKKSVVTIHDIGFKRQEELYSKARLGYKGRFFDGLVKLLTGGRYRATHLDYLEWSTLFALEQAAKVITISEFSKKEIIEVYKAKAEKIAVVYNGYDREMYRRVTDEGRILATLDKYGINRPFVFYVGRLEKKKNTARLIEAFALLKNEHSSLEHKLVLVGDASFGYDQIRLAVHQYGLHNEVILTGWVEEADMPVIFSAATAFIFPSHYEGFGIPLLQAMACGTPIVASSAASIPEIAGEAAWYFNPTDTEEMAEKITDVILSQDLRAELLEAAQEQIKQFSWQRAARETLAVLKSL